MSWARWRNWRRARMSETRATIKRRRVRAPGKLELFVRRNAAEERSGCWLWTHGIARNGYGNSGGKYAHREAYKFIVGPIPPGRDLDHLCRVRNRVNPAHLEPVTRAENLRRGMSPSAIASRKTHCANGHALTQENCYPSTNGRRTCKLCCRARAARNKRGSNAAKGGG